MVWKALLSKGLRGSMWHVYLAFRIIVGDRSTNRPLPQLAPPVVDSSNARGQSRRFWLVSRLCLELLCPVSPVSGLRAVRSYVSYVDLPVPHLPPLPSLRGRPPPSSHAQGVKDARPSYDWSPLCLQLPRVGQVPPGSAGGPPCLQRQPPSAHLPNRKGTLTYHLYHWFDAGAAIRENGLYFIAKSNRNPTNF